MIGDRKQGGIMIMRALLIFVVWGQFQQRSVIFWTIFIFPFVELDVCDVCSVSVHVTVNLNHEYNLWPEFQLIMAFHTDIQSIN